MNCSNGCDKTFLNLPLSDSKVFQNDEISPVCGLAQAWVPIQPSGEILYSACEGLRQGTIYPSLDKPYICNLERECCDNG